MHTCTHAQSIPAEFLHVGEKIYYQSKWFTYLNLVGIFGWNLMRGSGILPSISTVMCVGGMCEEGPQPPHPQVENFRASSFPAPVRCVVWGGRARWWITMRINFFLGSRVKPSVAEKASRFLHIFISPFHVGCAAGWERRDEGKKGSHETKRNRINMNFYDA